MLDGCRLRILRVDAVAAQVKPAVTFETKLALTFLTDERDQLFARKADGGVVLYATVAQFVEILAGFGVLAKLSVSLGEIEISLGCAQGEDIADGVVYA